MLNRIRKVIEKSKIVAADKSVASQLVAIISRNNAGQIPTIVVCFNNHHYVSSMVNQLMRLGVTPIIIDNNSHLPRTKDFLHSVEVQEKAFVVRAPYNLGSKVGFHEQTYSTLPKYFAYTDPDLLLNPKLPASFLVDLARVTEDFSVFKAGFALDFPSNLAESTSKFAIPARLPNKDFLFSPKKWESRFWRFPLHSGSLQLWAASIDTTFAVYNKENYIGLFEDGVRVAGDYSALHMPWFPSIDIATKEDKERYLSVSKNSTWR